MGDYKPFRLSVDMAKCEGHGMCEQVAAKLIHLNDDAEPVFDLDDIAPAYQSIAEEAVQSCPVAALTIYTTRRSAAQPLQGQPEPTRLRKGAALAHR